MKQSHLMHPRGACYHISLKKFFFTHKHLISRKSCLIRHILVQSPVKRRNVLSFLPFSSPLGRHVSLIPRIQTLQGSQGKRRRRIGKNYVKSSERFLIIHFLILFALVTHSLFSLFILSLRFYRFCASAETRARPSVEGLSRKRDFMK